MAVIFRSKIIEGTSGYFADSIGIGTKQPADSLHIKSGNLNVESGVGYFGGGVQIGDFSESPLPNLFVNNLGVGINNENPLSALDVSGQVRCSGIDLNNNKITNLPWPSLTGDAVTLGFLLQLSGYFQAQIDSLR
jgi:hypothetical protein